MVLTLFVWALACAVAIAGHYGFGFMADIGLFDERVADIVTYMSSGWGLMAAALFMVTSSYDMLELVKANYRSHGEATPK